jgi:AcrR family transcriptional regulator
MRSGIVRVAREIMREQGVAALNLNEIARRVGISAPALYTYFDGKSALYDELYRIGVELLIQAEEDLRRSTSPDWERIRQWFVLRVRIAESDPDLYHLVFDAPMPGFLPSPENLELIRLLYDAAASNISDVIAAGAMQPDLPLLEAIDVLISMRLGLVASHLGKHRKLPTPDRLETLVPSMVEILRAAWEPRSTSSP